MCRGRLCWKTGFPWIRRMMCVTATAPDVWKNVQLNGNATTLKASAFVALSHFLRRWVANCSWVICITCGGAHRVGLDMRRLTSIDKWPNITGRCMYCRSKYYVPKREDFPVPLLRLPRKVVFALSSFPAFPDHEQGQGGFRRHTKIASIRCSPRDVTENLKALLVEMQEQGFVALGFLTDQCPILRWPIWRRFACLCWTSRAISSCSNSIMTDMYCPILLGVSKTADVALDRALKNFTDSLHELLLNARALEDLNKQFGPAKFLITLSPAPTRLRGQSSTSKSSLVFAH